MSDENDDLPPIPEPIEEVLRDEEIENLRALDGWAVGTVVHVADGEEEATLDDVWIELFNGEGRARRFGGVKAFASDEGYGGVLDHLESDEPYFETYAYATPEAFGDREDGWYVREFTHPEEPDYGEPA